ncbi:MAG: hypothetical protein PHV37_07840 [Candidatus Gastranaerophilales bacterium]|nr:hypothetical protein [Candidatus Gastranaerophilales bacterium]
MKKNLLALFCVGVGLSALFSGKALALNEITLPIDTTTDSIHSYQPASITQTQENYKQNLFENDAYSTTYQIAQALTPGVKIDLGVQKNEANIENSDANYSTIIDENGKPTFVQRISIEENRPKPLQIFNKDGYQFEGGPIKSFKMGLLYVGGETLTYPWEGSRIGNNWNNTVGEISTITKFKDNKTTLRFSYNLLKFVKGHENRFMEKVSEMGLVYEFNKHNQVHLGQTWRLPIGVDGYVSTFNQDLPTRSQIGRTFGNTRSFGIRNVGNYKYMDYDIGLYDSTRYWENLTNGVDFTSWLTLKPLANLDAEKFGKLTMGTGISTGKNDVSYSVYGAYIGYDYKNFHNKFEYSHADGFNAGAQGRNECEGFYDTIIYDINKKLQVIGRYDVFNPNLQATTHLITECTGGLAYKISNSFKILAAYTYRNVDNGEHSNMISIQTRVKI